MWPTGSSFPGLAEPDLGHLLKAERLPRSGRSLKAGCLLSCFFVYKRNYPQMQLGDLSCPQGTAPNVGDGEGGTVTGNCPQDRGDEHCPETGRGAG